MGYSHERENCDKKKVITVTICLMKKMAHKCASRSAMRKNPCLVLLQMVVIQQNSIKFRLIDWLIYTSHLFIKSALTLLNKKFSGVLSDSCRHPQRKDEVVGVEEDCWYWWSIANTTKNPRLRCLKTSVLALIHTLSPFRLSHSLFTTVLCNRVYNFLHFI